MSLEKLYKLIECKKHWCVPDIYISVCANSLTDEEASVNMVKHIGPEEDDEKIKTLHETLFLSNLKYGTIEKFYLPKLYNRNDNYFRKQVLNPYISNLFDSQGGGGIICVEVRKLKGGTQSRVTYGCFRNRKYNSQKKSNLDKKTCRTTSTTRPHLDESTCKFRLNLYFEPTDSTNDTIGRWFFYKNGTGCRYHHHHLPKSDCEIKKRVNQVDPDQLKIACDGLKMNLPASAMQALLREYTGSLLTPHQLRFNLKCIQSDVEDASSMVGTTVADCLIYNLQKEPDLSFIMLTAEVSLAEQLLTVRHKKTTSIKLISRQSQRNCVAELNDSDILNNICNDQQNLMEETPLEKARKIYQGLSISGLAEVLLAVAWVNDEQRRQMAMYPEFVANDVIMWTNSEGRPSFRLATKNSSNQTIPCKLLLT